MGLCGKKAWAKCVTGTGVRLLPPHSRTPRRKSEQLEGQAHWKKVPDGPKAQQWPEPPQPVDLTGEFQFCLTVIPRWACPLAPSTFSPSLSKPGTQDR